VPANLLLIVFDTAREDALRPATSPAVADLASRGRWFRHAVAPAPWTLPSHGSILTGLRPSEHGITGATVMQADGPRSTRPRIEQLGEAWLPSALKAKGYATFGCSANPWVGPALGFTTGFDEFHESWRHAKLPKLGSPLEVRSGTDSSLTRYRKAARVHARRITGRGDGGAGYTLGALERFLAGNRRPFFGFMNLMEPHAPYVPPRGYGAKGRRRLDGLGAVRRWTADRMILFSLGRDEISDEDLSLLRDMYAAELSYCDRVLSRVLETLDAKGLLEETVVAVTSDHGESLGEHHKLSHVLSMHEPLLHVPLALAGPGVPKGLDDAVTGLLTLAPMLRGLAEDRWVDPDPARAVAEYESASNQVSAGERIEERFGGLTDDQRAMVRARWVAAYEGRFKYLTSSEGEEALYDLAADPQESVDVRREHPDVTARLAARRGAWTGADNVPAEALDEEIVSHLQGLGYL
jgi:arylsulfatase A-like enzyme